jgi:hypothetical protein
MAGHKFGETKSMRGILFGRNSRIIFKGSIALIDTMMKKTKISMS